MTKFSDYPVIDSQEAQWGDSTVVWQLRQAPVDKIITVVTPLGHTVGTAIPGAPVTGVPGRFLDQVDPEGPRTSEMWYRRAREQALGSI